MAFLTDRKRATGLGSAKSGTQHFWRTRVQSVALFFLIPLFIFTFGPILGSSYEEVTAFYARPFPAVVAGLTILVSWFHFADGVQVLIEDYVHGLAEKILILLMTCISYAAAAFGIYAVVRLAL
ncbi:succinate dehydrogenase, hydrophobic membrane anchor protein [Roseivivax marinus]|uniref:Succinate dehydrogenase hydrophobic membrane anchor subunit n=1 Tax=Roseivivax marinus TaxID=1379903 RepID=W4HM86_9RHOB|nr:succinate dehydrogenase, hydrophobic membrane anchor protein [Roseivivax marinus]ETW13518.1 succinate dehydrogenase, hydrophobic membrane anchor protein [Roseivivax marinus]